MTAVPPEALAAAIEALADTCVFSDDIEHALKAAAPHIRADLVREHVAEQYLIHEDMGALLRALGMFDGARPESPHQVMLLAIAEAGRIRADERARIRQLATERKAVWPDPVSFTTPPPAMRPFADLIGDSDA